MASNNEILEKLLSIENTLKGLIEVNARLSQEIIHIKTDGKNAPGLETKVFNTGATATEKKSTGINIKTVGDKLQFSGNTYNYRGVFGENEGSWNKDLKVWETPLSKLDDIKSIFDDKEVKYTVI